MNSMLFIHLAAQCAPQVPVDVLGAIAQVESGVHAWAVRVDDRSEIAKSAGEAVALTVGHLDQGREVAIGVMGLNARTLNAQGLSYADAFDACRNLEAAGRLIDGLWAAAEKMGVSPTQAERHVIRGYFQPALGRTLSVDAFETRVRAEKLLLHAALPKLVVGGAAVVNPRTSSGQPHPGQRQSRRSDDHARSGPIHALSPMSRASEHKALDVYGAEASSDLVAFSK